MSTENSVAPLQAYRMSLRPDFFSVIAIIASFLAAIQIAMLSFQNDILSKDSIDRQILPGHGVVYTFSSLGAMLGTIAVWVYIILAVMAAMKQLANQVQGARGYRALSMIILFLALCASGTSLVLLCLDFDTAFAAVLGSGCFCILALALISILSISNVSWSAISRHGWKENTIRFLSLLGLGIVFGLSVSFPAPPIWPPLLMVAATLAYHLLSYMPWWAEEGDEMESSGGRADEHAGAGNCVGQPGETRAKRLGFPSGCLCLCLGWAACAVITATWGTRHHSHHKVGQSAQWTITAIATLQALWMGVHSALSE